MKGNCHIRKIAVSNLNMSRSDRIPLKRGKRWHFNVIYNNAKSKMSQTEDTKLSLKVTEELVRRATLWGFHKSYYTDRDALPGQNIFGELFTVIQGSEYTIVILTKEFVNNYWAKYCQMAAFKTLLDTDISYKLIGILIGVNEEALPKNMSLNRYISFTVEDWLRDKDSWDLLKQMMEDPLLVSDVGTVIPIHTFETNVRPIQEEGGVPSTNRRGTSLLNHGGSSLTQYGQPPSSAVTTPIDNTVFNTTVFPDGPDSNTMLDGGRDLSLGNRNTTSAGVNQTTAGSVSIQSPPQQQSTTPTGYPSTQQQNTTPTGYPSTQQQSTSPTGYPSTQQQNTTPTGYPSTQQQSTTPTGYPSTRQQSTTHTGYPSTQQQNTTPTGYPSTHQQSTTPTGYPSTQQQNTTPTDYPSTQQQSTTPTGYPPTQQQNTPSVVYQYEEETEVKSINTNTFSLGNKPRRDVQTPVQGGSFLPPFTRSNELNSHLGAQQGLTAAPTSQIPPQSGRLSDTDRGIMCTTLQRINTAPSANSYNNTSRTPMQTSKQTREQDIRSQTTLAAVSDQVHSTGNTGATDWGNVATNVSNSNQRVGDAENVAHNRGNEDMGAITKGSMDFSDLSMDRGTMPSPEQSYPTRHCTEYNQSVGRNNNSGLQNSVNNLMSAPATEPRSHCDSLRTSASKDPMRSLHRNQHERSDQQSEKPESLKTCHNNENVSGVIASQFRDSGLYMYDAPIMNFETLLSGNGSFETSSSENGNTKAKQIGNSLGQSSDEDYYSKDSSGQSSSLDVQRESSDVRGLPNNVKNSIVISRTVTGDTKCIESSIGEVPKDSKELKPFQSHGNKGDQRTPDGSTTNQISSVAKVDQTTSLNLEDHGKGKLAMSKSFGSLNKNGILGQLFTAVENSFLK